MIVRPFWDYRVAICEVQNQGGAPAYQIGSSELTACIGRASTSTTRSIAMHNPDQRYAAHILHLKDLYEQAEHNRKITALMQHRHARIRAAGRRLGVLLVTLGTWLARGAQRDECERGRRVCQACAPRAC
jgi:hypothetical protein